MHIELTRTLSIQFDWIQAPRTTERGTGGTGHPAGNGSTTWTAWSAAQQDTLSPVWGWPSPRRWSGCCVKTRWSNAHRRTIVFQFAHRSKSRVSLTSIRILARTIISWNSECRAILMLLISTNLQRESFLYFFARVYIIRFCAKGSPRSSGSCRMNWRSSTAPRSYRETSRGITRAIRASGTTLGIISGITVTLCWMPQPDPEPRNMSHILSSWIIVCVCMSDINEILSGNR